MPETRTISVSEAQREALAWAHDVFKWPDVETRENCRQVVAAYDAAPPDDDAPKFCPHCNYGVGDDGFCPCNRKPPTGRVEVDPDTLQTWSLAVLLGARLAEADNRKGIATNLRRTYNEMRALAAKENDRG